MKEASELTRKVKQTIERSSLVAIAIWNVVEILNEAGDFSLWRKNLQVCVDTWDQEELEDNLQ
jgi:hypothetical protein